MWFYFKLNCLIKKEALCLSCSCLLYTSFGYNARTDVYENLHAAGVVEPAKVTRVALENAASIAGMFLTTVRAL